MQDCSISITNALKILQLCNKPSICCCFSRLHFSLSLNMLHCFTDYKRCFHILYHMLHYAKLPRAMQAPWVDRFLNNEIYCYPLLKSGADPQLRSPLIAWLEGIVTSDRQQHNGIVIKRRRLNSQWTNPICCLSYTINAMPADALAT